MIKLVLFDLGGVVIDISNHEHYKYLAKTSGIPSREIALRMRMENVAHERGDISYRKFMHDVADDLGIAPEQVLWMHYFKKFAKLNRRVVDIAKKLKKNYKLGFLSNVDSERYNYAIRRILKPILPVFDYKFASYKLREVKPSPAIYRKVLKLTKLKPEEMVFVDNDIRNVDGAMQVGIKAIRFTSVLQLKEDLKRLGIKM
ncbi:MAG: HAD family phosphatase [Candidatus Micrarchaeota archaeon]|nr:HAD family phosphatase [Candidatus Micrarchaeota archaeon]MDE1859787.1 HAD family phosphatase [Candidatus Micrarchaeota archaeon]